MIKYLQGFNKYRGLLFELVSKDIKLKYRRSFLGIIWSLLNPLLMMLVITAVFQNIFKFDVENFPVFYLTGSVLFNFVIESTTSALSSITSAGGLIRKVYIPKYIFTLEKVLFSVVNLMFSMVAVFIMIIALKVKIHQTVILFIVPIIYTMIFSTGIGLMLASINVFFRDIMYIYSIFTSIWFYLTPIIYPITILPKTVSIFVNLNPMYYYVEYFRSVLLYGEVPNFETNLICIAFSLGSLILGLFIFKKNQDRFILYI